MFDIKTFSMLVVSFILAETLVTGYNNDYICLVIKEIKEIKEKKQTKENKNNIKI